MLHGPVTKKGLLEIQCRDCVHGHIEELVRGGQGKDAREVFESGFWFGACIVAMVFLLLAALIGLSS